MRVIKHIIIRALPLIVLQLLLVKNASSQTHGSFVVKWRIDSVNQLRLLHNPSIIEYNKMRLNVIHVRIKLQSIDDTVNLTDFVYRESEENRPDVELDLHSPLLGLRKTMENGLYYANLTLYPYKLEEGNRVMLMTKFSWTIVHGKSRTLKGKLAKSGTGNASVLSTGEWYKVRCQAEGIYKLDHEFLSNMGLDLTSVKFGSIQIYGGGGGMLPEIIDSDTNFHLKEVQLKKVDANNNDILDPGDYILLYSTGNNPWIFSGNRYVHQFNIYDDYVYYFITHSRPKAGRSIGMLPSNPGLTAEREVNTYDELIFHEIDHINLIKSGRRWYGESFKHENNKGFSFTVPNVAVDSPARLIYRMAARATSRSKVSVSINNTPVSEQWFDPVSGDYTQNFVAPPSTKNIPIQASNSMDINFLYAKNSFNDEAWLDFFELQLKRQAILFKSQHIIHSSEAIYASSIKYTFQSEGYQFWDVSDIWQIKEQSSVSGGAFQEFHTFNSDQVPKKYIAFDSKSFHSMEFVKRIEPQNLHAVDMVDFIIVTHPDFIEEAEELRDFHMKYYGQSVVVVTTEQVYNEFSAGRQDVVGIRNFVRLVYKKGSTSNIELKNLLLFGDGSYDYKGLVYPGSNFVPTYQSPNSYSPTASYSSDDFYAILDDEEGRWGVNRVKEGLDIGVGRLPARNKETAKVLIAKIKAFHDAKSYGSWRYNVTLLADDEDRNIHFWDSENVAGLIGVHREYNIKKIYMDAYEQVSFGSGQKYPDVNLDINRSFTKGHILFNYLGHGGESGMALERVITRPQIRSWVNPNRLPIMITATCELSRFDDPSQDSPGELMLYNDVGGVIGLITTTRLVYIGDNSDLNDAVVNNNLFAKKTNGEWPTLGEVYTRSKNGSIGTVNQRNFILLGDPAMRLGYTNNKVQTKSVVNLTDSSEVDTINAFSKVQIKGEVKANEILLKDFDGTVEVVVYDKPAIYQTLANDPDSRKAEFNMQNNIIYKGNATVNNGEFSVSFVVPKDIGYKYGRGKIFYYAYNDKTDAQGQDESIVIGGSSQKAVLDSIPPTIELFLNDENFIEGGITGPNPILLAKLFDDNGINTLGNGIGRNIRITIDPNTEQEKQYNGNEFYSADINSYKSGALNFQLNELADGPHVVRLKVWDVFNNSQEADLSFVVGNDNELVVANQLNYPNPFTTSTVFHFDHNQVGQNLDVKVKIISITGRVVKVLGSNVFVSGNHFSGLPWDGRDDYGDEVARGVYLYHLKITTEDGKAHTSTNKLYKIR